MNSTEISKAPGEPISDALTELALNLRWSWNHSADEIWSRLDSELWELTQNPWVILQAVSSEKLESAFADPVFQEKLSRLIQEKHHQEQTPRWFQKTYPKPPF